MTQTVTIHRPDDWHVHLRDGAMMRAVLPYTARHFRRAIVMPNLSPPITTAEMARAYRTRIRAAVPAGMSFKPLMTCYLTDETDPDELEEGFLNDGSWVAAKLYPAGATTGSAHGVTNIKNIRRVIERMEEIDMPLLVHGEVADPDVDVFDREAVFIDRVLVDITTEHPDLRVVLEHVSTKHGVEFVHDEHHSGKSVAATITPHHLLYTHNDLLADGMRPHRYCKPIVKRNVDRDAIRWAATSGLPCFFLGTDSAPHPLQGKESACCPAGVFNAPAAIASYAQVFEEVIGALDERFEAFAARNGPAFYGLPVNEETITLERCENAAPPSIVVDDGYSRDFVVPFRAGEPLSWRMCE